MTLLLMVETELMLTSKLLSHSLLIPLLGVCSVPAFLYQTSHFCCSHSGLTTLSVILGLVVLAAAFNLSGMHDLLLHLLHVFSLKINSISILLFAILMLLFSCIACAIFVLSFNTAD